MKKLVTLLLFAMATTICLAQNLSKEGAIEDINEFRSLLETQSSYFQLSNFDLETSLSRLMSKIASTDSIPVHELAFEFEKIISETIDRHASVKMKDFDEDEIELCNLHFPFVLAPLNGKAAGLVFNREIKQFEFYDKAHPFVKSINGMPTDQFIERYAYRRKNSPTAAKLYDGLKDVRDIGELFFKQGEFNHKEIDIVMTDGEIDRALTLPFSPKKQNWVNIGDLQDRAVMRAMYFDEPFEYSKLDQWQEDAVGYIRIPMMIAYEDYTDFEDYLTSTIQKYADAKALVIDIRGNGGGRRDILNTMAGFLVQPEESPWVANVAYIRNDQQLDEDIESMTNRYLFNYDSEHLTDDDREGIDSFMEDFKTEISFDSKKFSQPFFMVLNSNGNPIKCPVYILIDEQCFSAASVFTSAFKGLSNVQIVGVNTNGSSGRSVRFNLKNSSIQIKLSTMLSFQRNGKTLDGNGTAPDLIIERDEAHILRQKDTQLERLLQMINQQ